MSAAVDIARSVPIEAELARRGHRLKRVGRDLVGPCPACGGTDRFAVTPAKRFGTAANAPTAETLLRLSNISTAAIS